MPLLQWSLLDQENPYIVLLQLTIITTAHGANQQHAPPAQVWMSYAAFEAAPLPLPEDEDEDEAAAAERQAAAQSGDEAPANSEARARRWAAAAVTVVRSHAAPQPPCKCLTRPSIASCTTPVCCSGC